MKTVRVETKPAYEVLIGSGLLDGAGERCKRIVSGRRALLVAGGNVSKLYGEKVIQSLQNAGFETYLYTFASGESAKTPETLFDILNLAAERGLDRDDIFIALGGGVCGDLCGLAAALYYRGTSYIQMPTSLLAMVDASVGGKTAVDLPAGKNLVGAFHQPSLVLCDTDCLRTLPAENYADGMAEAIKCACLGGEELFCPLESGTINDINDLIYSCVRLKAELVAQDERDLGARRLLNLGHTLAHAIEKCSDYKISHGTAVAAGMAVMTRGCVRLGLCEPGLDKRLESILKRYGLPTSCDIPLEPLLNAARNDKKRCGGNISLVLPRSAGICRIETLPFSDFDRIVRMGI